MQDALGSYGIFPVKSMEWAISPVIPIYFVRDWDWETNTWSLGVLFATEVSLILALSRERVEKYFPSICTYLNLFMCFIYQHLNYSKRVFILKSLTSVQHHKVYPSLPLCLLCHSTSDSKKSGSIQISCKRRKFFL